MLVIRLTRRGKKNQPFFRIVVIDKRRSAKGGRAVEILGYIDPLTKRKSLKKERILYWMSKGSKPSPTVHNLLVSEKIINAKKINKSKKPKKKEEITVTASALTVKSTPMPEALIKPVENKPETIKEELKPEPSSLAKAVGDKKKPAEPQKPAA